MPDSSQSIVITETTRAPRVRKALLLALVLLPIAWSIGVREWDEYVAYSGTIVEKGMGCGILCWFGRSHDADLYIVLQDERGHHSKRYIGTTRSSHYLVSWWSNAPVGSFVVKDKGDSELPHALGTNPPVRPQGSSFSGVLLFLIILVFAGALFFEFRQLWKDI